jgi:hypothetical protein
MDTTASSAYAWALHEIGFADFNDERLTRRGVDIAATFLQHPQQSIPQSCGSWARTKAVYRFFTNEKIQSAYMLAAHKEQLLKRAASYVTILVAQDTTVLNLSGREMTGLGSIGGGTSQGLFVHSALAMSPNGIPLGIVSQKVYARKEETKTPAYRKKAYHIPITEKESVRWVEVVDKTKQVLQNKHAVVIGDRESDIYEVFERAGQQGIDVLIRTSKNRLLKEAGQRVKLFDAAAAGEIVVTYETEVPIDHHSSRMATLTVKTSVVNLRSTRGQGEDIPVTILHVQEEHPPQGMKPIRWMLTTSLSVMTAEDAIEKVTWYIYRWRIERFHYTLKTGAFNIEKLQFETGERFVKAITLYSIVAWRVVFTTYQARACPQEDATTIFSDDEIRALCLMQKKRSNQQLTIKEAVIATATLGGYLARKHDGPPGIKSLWIGFQTLTTIVCGMIMEQEAHLME